MKGVLTSPGYPNTYRNYMECCYVVSIPQGMAMNIAFEDFELEGNSGCTHMYP